MIAPLRLVRLYGLVAGAGLLIEGGALLALDVLGVMPGDTRHNALHTVWGAAILALLAVGRGTEWMPLLVVGGFGVFYTGLAMLGVLVHQPFGLLLGPGENVFHFVVGPLALLLAGRAAVQRSSNSNRSADSVSSAGSGSTSGA